MKTLMILLCPLLASCTTPHSGPAADVGSTLVASATQNVKEAGLIAGAPNSLPVGLVLSLGTRMVLVNKARGTEDCEVMAGWTEAFGWGATCNNLAVAMGAAPQVSIPLLVLCSITVKKSRADETEAWCGEYELTDLPCTLNNLPDDAKAASCINGRLALK